MTAVARWAHLLGFKSAKSAEKPDDEDDNELARRDGETDEEYEARKAKHAEDEKKKEEDAKAAAEAARITAAAKASTSDDDEMRGAEVPAQARARERARCAAIFSVATPDTIALAASLAFDTTMSRSEAVDVLATAAATMPKRAAVEAAPKADLRALMAAERVPVVTGASPKAAPAGAKALAARIIDAYNASMGRESPKH